MHRISINRDEENQLSAAKGNNNARESKSTGGLIGANERKREKTARVFHTHSPKITNYFCQSFKYFFFSNICHLSRTAGRSEICELALIPFIGHSILNPLRSFCIANPFTFRFTLVFRLPAARPKSSVCLSRFSDSFCYIFAQFCKFGSVFRRNAILCRGRIRN